MPHSFHVSPDLTELLQLDDHGRTYVIMVVIAQVAALLASTKLAGWFAERCKIPGVVGELLAGTFIGPFLLGSMIQLPIHGHWIALFPRPAEGQWPINNVVWAFSQFASIVLLFVTGLHTDFRQFVRYLGPATLIAIVGLLAPFALGVGTVYLPFFSDAAAGYPGQSHLVPALFVGAILAATSIGITARVLSDIQRLDTPEGVTILGAAVLDDVFCVIALAVVGGIASAGSISAGTVVVVAGKAFGFWLALTVLTLILATTIERFLTSIRYSGAMVGLALAFAFIASAAAESFGLAFIIGAYSVGLGLSRTKMAHTLMDELRPIGDFLVPIFFASLGMLVDLRSMFGDVRMILFGLVLTLAAIVGKLIGCGAAARATGFNLRGAYRIGLGMMPRGEVALIVAGVGLSQGLIRQGVFSASILMTLLTTLIAPVLLVPAFARGGSGRKDAYNESRSLPSISEQPGVTVPLPTDLGQLLIERLLRVAESRGWNVSYERAGEEIYLLRSGPDAAELRMADGELKIDASDRRQKEFLELVAEARDSIRDDAAKVVVS